MKNPLLIILVVLAISFLTTCNRTKSTDWAQFRGNNASGIAPHDSKPPVVFGEDENLLWKIDLPVGSSSPVLWENHLYLTAYVEENKELQTLCIERTTGQVLWSKSIFPEKFEKPHAVADPAPATIAADTTGIYVYFASYGIMHLDHEGNLRWDYPIPVPENVLYGNPSSPVIMDNKIILKLDYGPAVERCLLALDKMNGEVIWKSFIQDNSPLVNYGYPGYSTPVRMQNQVIVHRCGGIAAYSLQDGSPIWWLQIMTNGIGTPIIHDGVIYISAWMELSEAERRGKYFTYDKFDELVKDFDLNGDKLIGLEEIPEDLMLFSRPGAEDIESTSVSVRRMFRGIDKDKNGLADESEWTNSYKTWSSVAEDFGLMAIPSDLKGELTLHNVLWMQMEKTPEVPSPLAYAGCIFMVKDGGWVTCMDAKSGEVYYQEKAGAPGPCIASPVLANGKIYLSAYNGTITVIEAGKTPVRISENKLQGKIMATPAIAGRNLYVRTSEHLYAFEE